MEDTKLEARIEDIEHHTPFQTTSNCSASIASEHIPPSLPQPLLNLNTTLSPDEPGYLSSSDEELPSDPISWILQGVSERDLTLDTVPHQENSLNPFLPPLSTPPSKFYTDILPSPPPTPVRADVLEVMLVNYDYDTALFLVKGFRYGFRLHLDITVKAIVLLMNEDQRAKVIKNHGSAILNKIAIQAKLDTELLAGRMIGPFEVSPFPYYIVSPLAATPKKNTGKYRLIHNLSFPKNGVSVNSCISQKKGEVHYTSIQTAIRMIQEVGPKSVLSKTDILHAYKLMPIHPEDVPALGLRWNGKLYFDRTLAMGTRTGCKLFEIFTTAVEFIAQEHGCTHICHILDDFLLVCPLEVETADIGARLQLRITDLHNVLAVGDFIPYRLAAVQ